MENYKLTKIDEQTVKMEAKGKSATIRVYSDGSHEVIDGANWLIGKSVTGKSKTQFGRALLTCVRG